MWLERVFRGMIHRCQVAPKHVTLLFGAFFLNQHFNGLKAKVIGGFELDGQLSVRRNDHMLQRRSHN